MMKGKEQTPLCCLYFSLQMVLLLLFFNLKELLMGHRSASKCVCTCAPNILLPQIYLLSVIFIISNWSKRYRHFPPQGLFCKIYICKMDFMEMTKSTVIVQILQFKHQCLFRVILFCHYNGFILFFQYSNNTLAESKTRHTMLLI